MGFTWKLTIDLSEESIANAVAMLRDFETQIRDSATKITSRLSEIAADEARERYDDDVFVYATDHGVIATGESVVFQEFGAGARISDPYDGGADVDFEIRKGAYSDLYGGEYAQSGYQQWHHNGEEYKYVTPRNALFYGMEAARAAAPRIAGEVFFDI